MTSGTRGTRAGVRLTDYLADELSPAVRERGVRYAARGAVNRLTVDIVGVRAVVAGRRRYTVTIDYELPEEDSWGEGRGLVLWANCTCPYLQNHHFICKHVWAALLAAEQNDAPGLPVVSDDEWAILEPEPDLPLREPTAGTEQRGDSVDRHGPPANGDAVRVPAVTDRSARRRPRGANRSIPSTSASRTPDWDAAMRSVVDARERAIALSPVVDRWPADRQVLYVLDLDESLEAPGLVLRVLTRQPKQNGEWSRPRTRQILRQQLQQLPDPADRQILSLLDGTMSEQRRAFSYELHPIATCVYLEPSVQAGLVERMCRTGRCCVGHPDRPDDFTPLTWSEERGWSLRLRVEDRGKAGCVIRGGLERQPADGEAGAEAMAARMPLSEPRLLTAGGLLFHNATVAPFEHHGAFEWVKLLRGCDEVVVRRQQEPAMLEQMLTLPGMPPVELPDRLTVEQETVVPTPHLRIHQPDRSGRGSRSNLTASLIFHYAEQAVAADDARTAVFDRDRPRVIPRDEQREGQAYKRLQALGVQRSNDAWRDGPDSEPAPMALAPSRMPETIATLIDEDWIVEAEGRLYRTAASLDLDLRGSGIDWFELHGEAAFDDQTLQLPQLLQALQRGDRYVRLDDGSVGMLPQEWIERYGPLAGLGEHGENGHVRLAPTQIGLIDALLAQMPEVDFDRQVARARQRLQRLSRIAPRQAPRGFHGELRPYQQEGLGWLHFLREIGFGGCLADDMGLGKTIQVLALLESRRQKRRRDKGRTPPSLVVAPRSLVHNWHAEASRFTPHLRVLDHTGPERLKPGGAGAEANDNGSGDPLAHFGQYDLVLTTYGTLRQDVAMLNDAPFDYVVLDESQAIKNAATATAKAARLLVAEHRLALSGTPIENHLGELVSLFAFLNPGMLGEAETWSSRSGSAARSDLQSDQTQLLARAVKPFILRRGKEQVAADLPEKFEQTLYCDLPAKQRKHYDELRRYYGAQVMGKVEKRGLGRSKIEVLQALLRLRQAACHPGLIDKSRANEPTAKLEMLLPQIEELIAEGHKALVFSQFTSFLGLVRKQVRARGIDHAYIDGRTRRRQEQVERFQEDPACKLFLISLKAGGTGLNLTAADYVFLLDPWWNPAVETQAIDRAHRIGQDKRVHAYRLIASNTVEEKVLELQQSKRELADAIIRADANLIRALSMDDLRYLLS